MPVETGDERGSGDNNRQRSSSPSGHVAGWALQRQLKFHELRTRGLTHVFSTSLYAPRHHPTTPDTSWILISTIFTPFFTLGPGSTTLYSSHALCHGLISSTTFLQHSTTLYSLQDYSSTAFLQSTTSTTPLWDEHEHGRRPGCVRTPSGAS